MYFSENGLIRTDFITTPKMSTYLPVLIVSDFACINGTARASGPDNADVPVKVCARPTAFNQLDYGLEIGIKSVEYLQDLLNYKYPLPKCGMHLKKKDKYKNFNQTFVLKDHAALPDFPSGAMENWGLITYRY